MAWQIGSHQQHYESYSVITSSAIPSACSGSDTWMATYYTRLPAKKKTATGYAQGIGTTGPAFKRSRSANTPSSLPWVPMFPAPIVLTTDAIYDSMYKRLRQTDSLPPHKARQPSGSGSIKHQQQMNGV
ncbi:hypothetical protein PLEOSDRAFT_1109342 [Pleurotus ostreatus PC15]|uniref:Uncharacterized protein n=1 Tax=Pleurotus ostreatus (strain PC15) TaxID=1137138 RepID=A0A067NDM6_PLEO1|nr:hypothetical protein PLEOSDRAFT_1109342 [Pleurotus ostreatus PC15]